MTDIGWRASEKVVCAYEREKVMGQKKVRESVCGKDWKEENG